MTEEEEQGNGEDVGLRSKQSQLDSSIGLLCRHRALAPPTALGCGARRTVSPLRQERGSPLAYASAEARTTDHCDSVREGAPSSGVSLYHMPCWPVCGLL
jgi:hypothetical protein